MSSFGEIMTNLTIPKLKNQLHLIGDRSIKRGTTYTLSMSFSGDVSQYSFYAQIRNGYSEDDAPLLATFNILTQYNNESNSSLVFFSLTEEQTSKLLPTIYQGGVGERPYIYSCYLWDAKYKNEQTNAVIPIIASSYVAVLKTITDLSKL